MQKRTETMTKQVGGDHYNKHMGLQVWDIIDEYQLDYYEGNALKYLLREKGNRIQDLEKAKHYIEKEIENLSEGEEELKIHTDSAFLSLQKDKEKIRRASDLSKDEEYIKPLKEDMEIFNLDYELSKSKSKIK